MKYLKCLITVMVLLAVSQTVQGAVLDSCDQWASYCSGSYCVYNAVWGATGSWSQCITASSCTSWTCTATHPYNGIKSYPNSGYLPSTTVGTSITGSVSASPPSGGTWNLSWDVWAPIEVMIWLRWQGEIGPWGSYVTTATIDGRGWDVYKNGYPGYLAQSQMSGGTFSISAFLADSVSRGWLSNGSTVTPVQCGYEIVGASNTTFTMNSFSVSVGGASTSTTTTASSTSTTTTASSTSTTTTSGGTGNITVRARGTQGGENIDLRVNGNTVASWSLTTSYQNYSGSGSGSVSVCFTNDNGPRDVQVDYVIIDGTTYQSEDQAVNTGQWINGQCGGSYSEWLGCNGCIEYAGGGGSTSTTTTASSTSTTTTASSTSTTASSTSTTSGGGCDCGTCNWWGVNIPMCCESCSGWGWYDGGCRRSCVCESSCSGGSVP